MGWPVMERGMGGGAGEAASKRLETRAGPLASTASRREGPVPTSILTSGTEAGSLWVRLTDVRSDWPACPEGPRWAIGFSPRAGSSLFPAVEKLGRPAVVKLGRASPASSLSDGCQDTDPGEGCSGGLARTRVPGAPSEACPLDTKALGPRLSAGAQDRTAPMLLARSTAMGLPTTGFIFIKDVELAAHRLAGPWETLRATVALPCACPPALWAPLLSGWLDACLGEAPSRLACCWPRAGTPQVPVGPWMRPGGTTPRLGWGAWVGYSPLPVAPGASSVAMGPGSGRSAPRSS